jgi:hypothetical protein
MQLEHRRKVIHNFSKSGDRELDIQLFDNIPIIRPINFDSPEHYKKFKIKNVRTNTELFQQTSTKLQILLETYSVQEFNKVKFYKLNADQILVFLTSPNFVNNAKGEKLVEALQHLYKTRQIKLYSRPEIMNVVRDLCLSQEYLEQIEPSYVAALAYTLMKMKIKDEDIWFGLAEYLMSRCNKYNIDYRP